MNEYISTIRGCGYRVFIRPNKLTGEVTYCFYTDGKHIGCAQWSDGRPQTVTVHKANRTTGTGFQFAENITAATIKGAAECFAPGWASSADIESVKKYASWDSYFNSSAWNRELIEV